MSWRHRSIERLRAAQAADLDRVRWWPRTRATLKRWEGRAKRLAALGSALAALGGAYAKLSRFIADRRIAPAELPATGQPTIATDRVIEPKPPTP